jgi:hypothetical protein
VRRTSARFERPPAAPSGLVAQAGAVSRASARSMKSRTTG